MTKIKQYKLFDILAFQEKLVEAIDTINLATAYFNALASLVLTHDKIPSD